MNWRYLDWTRRNATPLEVDLIEHYAAGKINRRDFVKRGAIIGLGTTTMAGVIAACGSDSDTDTAGDTATTAGDGGDTTAAPATTAGTGQQGGTMVVAVQPLGSGLDPIAMQDFGTYTHITQCFEFLVGVSMDSNISDQGGLATSWSSNETGDVWTFDLRQGVKWQNGGDFTSADVAATMDRLVAAEDPGLAGVIDTGSVDTTDPNTAVFNLINPNGQFPALLSMFNPSACITPVDYENGTLLDQRPDGTGPFKIVSYDGSEVAIFERNPDWWGGTTPLDGVELRQFDSVDTQVTALQAGDIDMIVQFDVIAGQQLFDDSSINVLASPSAAHRKVWMQTSNPSSQFTNRNLRRAMAYAMDRDQIIQSLYQGRATLANDHPVHESLAFFDPDAVPQREKDIDMAKAELAEAGVDSVDTVLNVGDNLEIPDMGLLMSNSAREAGINFTVNTTPQGDFYDVSWCPPDDSGENVPCYNNDEFGIVDWGHRPTPDLFLTSGMQSGAIWNGSSYQNSEYDALVTAYQVSLDVDSQRTAIGNIQKHLWEEVPALYLNFTDHLGAHGPRVQGAWKTSLGQAHLWAASIV